MVRATIRSGLLRLVTGPAGSGKTQRALERIREAATQEAERGRAATAPGRALLVLPTYAQALRARRLALTRWDARAVLDAPFATFTSAGERFLPGFRVRALPSAEERDRLMEEALRRSAPAGFGAGVAERRGLRAKLLRLLKEAKQTGLDPREALARLERSAAALGAGARDRLVAFVRVAQEYESLRTRAGLEDHEDSLRRLRDSLVAEPPLDPPRVLVVDGFDDFTSLEEGILDALTDAVATAGGEVLVTLPWDPARPALFAGSAPARERLVDQGFQEEPLTTLPRQAGPALERIARDLFADAAAPPAPGGDEVTTVVAGDPEDEAEAVARAVRGLAGQFAWREVGVVVRRLDERSGPRILAALERLGVPVRWVGGGPPLAAEALLRALRGPLCVLGGLPDFAPEEILAWLRWCAHAERDNELLRVVDVTELAGRRDGFSGSWEAFRASAPTAASERLGRLEAHRARLALLRGPGAVWPALEEAIRDLAPLPPLSDVDATGRAIDPALDRRAARSALALDRLVAACHAFRRAAKRTGLGASDAAEAVVELLDSAEATPLVLPDTRLDCVSVMDAEEARFWELPAVVVAGLSEGEFPLRPREDPIVRDADREEIRRGDPDLGLPLARDGETRERRLFYGALTRARRRLVLVRARSDADGGPREPSPFLRDLARVVALSPAAPRPLGRAAPALADAFTREDLRLFAAFATGAGGSDASLAAALLDARADDPAHPRRRAARGRRPLADVLPGEARTFFRFSASLDRVSPSLIDDARTCLHRHFLARVARVPADDVPFAGAGFERRDLGSVLHDALRRAAERPDALPDEVARDAVADARIEDLDRDLLLAEVERVVRLWRDRERRVPGWRAHAQGLELAFGARSPHGAVRVVSGEGAPGFLLEGRVDRVEVDGGRAVVVDFKTSKDGAKRGATLGRDLQDLQLPLYALAVEKLLAVEVVGLEWVAATRRERYGLWSDADAASLAARREGPAFRTVPPEGFRDLLATAARLSEEVLERIRAGEHAKTPGDAKACARCAHRAVCRPAAFVEDIAEEAP